MINLVFVTMMKHKINTEKKNVNGFFSFCFPVTKKPDGNVDEIENFFGCSAAQLIMVLFSFLIYHKWHHLTLLLKQIITGWRLMFHRCCLWKSKRVPYNLDPAFKRLKRAIHCSTGKHNQKITFN